MVYFPETTSRFRAEHAGTRVLNIFEVHTEINVLENVILAKAFALSKKVPKFQDNPS